MSQHDTEHLWLGGAKGDVGSQSSGWHSSTPGLPEVNAAGRAVNATNRGVWEPPHIDMRGVETAAP